MKYCRYGVKPFTIRKSCRMCVTKIVRALAHNTWVPCTETQTSIFAKYLKMWNCHSNILHSLTSSGQLNRKRETHRQKSKQSMWQTDRQIDMLYCFNFNVSFTSISSEWIINLRFASSKAKIHLILLGGTGTKTTRLPGYSIRVSNESTWTSSLICYQDPGNTTLPDIIEKECHMTGQFVWIYQDNKVVGPCPMLEICEVQIFGRFRIY